MTSQSIYTEYTNLTPDEIQWLDGCGAKWKSGKTIIQEKPDSECLLFSEDLEDNKYFFFNCYEMSKRHSTHIPTGSEFCERVAEILGIEKPVFGDKFIKAFEPNEEEINKGIDKAEKEWEVKEGAPSYPHRLYRVLDSLGVVSFDKRMPLSEWIPPMGAEVIFIVKNEVIPGHVKSIGYNHCIVWAKTNKEEYVPLDGHWMRIV